MGIVATSVRQTREKNIFDTAFTDAVRMATTSAKPFVKWVGGKRQLLSQFRERGLYPPHTFDASSATYYEPFVGGGAVFFDLMPPTAILSDMNAELVMTYTALRDDVEAVIRALDGHIYDKEHFLRIRSQKPSDLTAADVAARFIYLNRTCFNGMYRVNSRGEFNVPFGRYENPQICDEVNLRRVATALRNTHILHKDYTHVLKTAQRGDFVYFDPPYHPVNATSSFTSYTAGGFTIEDQVQLRDAFTELAKRGCYVMLSNSDTPFIRDIYTLDPALHTTIHTVYAGRNINSKAAKRGKVQEVVVTNY